MHPAAWLGNLVLRYWLLKSCYPLAAPDYYIGLPQWNHPTWHEHLFAGDQPEPLAAYAGSFNSVEGNTTFYGLPSADAVARWARETGADFRFCFKFPSELSHQNGLHDSDEMLLAFISRLALLEERLGMLWLQLPAAFGPAQLDLLARFLMKLPAGFRYAVETRHPAFFERGDADRQLTDLLAQAGVNRLCFDTRVLFRHPSNDRITQEALKAKPRLPLRPVATAGNPMLRFIAPLDMQLADQELDYWAARAAKWIEEGRTPWLFFHTPDNAQAPLLAQRFAEKMQGYRGFRPWPEPSVAQGGLF